MKRRPEFLVAKRDGRTEWLRATKLARSVHLALQGSGIDEDWRALEIASAVLAGLRARHDLQACSGRPVCLLSTGELADAVQEVLVAIGQPRAAAAYGAVGAERSRRRRSLSAIADNRPAMATDQAVLPATGRNFHRS